MKMAMNSVILTLSIVVLTARLGIAQTNEVLPTADEVVARMIQLDARRQTQLQGYTATRHYVAFNKQRRAEMLVRITCTKDGVKEFATLSEEGSRWIRKHVLYKMLKEEAEASRRDTRSSTRIIPANYDFQGAGQDIIDGRSAYVLSLIPKAENKYLIAGKIWVDATDYSIVRIEGRPTRNPSFWTRNVHFVHTYEKVGPFWFAASTHSVSEIRIFGPAELTIENSEYSLNPPDHPTVDRNHEARLSE